MNVVRGGAREAAEPAQDLGRVGVRRHRVDALDPGVDRDRLAVDLDASAAPSTSCRPRVPAAW